jgi:protein-disulfide isomerase
MAHRPARRPPLGGRSLAAAVAAGAALVAGALVAASLVSARGDDGPAPPPASAQPTVRGAAETERLLRGIPQDGIALGSPNAPVTLVEFADLQCPYCALWAQEAFPAIVDEYVRPGRVRIVFRGLAFLGPDSETALRTALAAGAQGRLWNVLHLLYTNQGAENAGWVTEDLLREIGGGVPGLDARRMLALRGSPDVVRQLAAAERSASLAGVHGTPSFAAGPTGGPLRPLPVDSLDAGPFRERLDDLLAR